MDWNWIKGKPTRPGLVVVHWMNGADPVELNLVVRLGDGELYFFPKGLGKPYPLSKSAIHHHIYIPQPVDPDGCDNGCEYTTDFNPETCEWTHSGNRPIWADDPNAELSEEQKKEVDFMIAALNGMSKYNSAELPPIKESNDPVERERLKQELKELKHRWNTDLKFRDTGLPK